MKTLAENLSNLTVLSDIEMSKVLGGTNNPNTATVEDEDVWL
ncbi:MAG: hypothetical protein RQ761_11595 [Bacteroidales bacterium]|nr:hypothetical protein [Bacteroidales bacterium]